MGKKKGFTLIEIIVSITLLSIIVLTIALNFNKIFDKTTEFNYADFVNKIKSSADIYLSGNNTLMSELNSNKGFIRVKIKDIKDAGLIDDKLINPNTKEIVNDNEEVLISLDEAGLYKFTYPANENDEYLQALNKDINYGESFDCLSELDTINLGLIDRNGNLVKDYFKTNKEAITCKNSTIDTKKLGHHVVEYSYLTQDGIQKLAKRNYIVIDNINPSITNIMQTPTTWTNGNVIITANVKDNESGIASYSININGCGSYIKTETETVSASVPQNGMYSVCARDKSGNTSDTKITINNIDKTYPSVQINKSTNSYVTSLTMNAVINDSESKINAYAINQSSSSSSISWTNVNPTNSTNINRTITANGTYYVWAKDVAGNKTNKSIVISNIGTLKRATFSTGELNSHNYSGRYNTGTTVKAIHSITTNTGSVTSSSVSGSVINYSLRGGKVYEGSYMTTCSYSAQYRKANYEEYCSRYTCPSGGSVSGSRCTGRTWSGSGYNEYTCQNGSWVSSYNSNQVICDSGYTKSYSCGSRPSGTCTSGTRRVSCTGTCRWRGDYNASCSRYSGEYSCPSGYTMSGTSCYKCDSSRDTLRGSTCSYDCRKYYDYYDYSVTIEYII